MSQLKKFSPVLILLAGLVVRLLFLGNNPAWYDEAFTILTARLPIDNMWSALLGDVHPPLYYMLARVLLFTFGGLNPVVVLRGFSVLCSLTGALEVWSIASMLGMSNRARLVALAMMCLFPVEVYYAQEGRMYALLQLIALQQFRAMHQRKWSVLAIASILAMYTHNYGAIYTGIIYLVAIGRELVNHRGGGLLKPGVFLSATGAGLTYAPWFLGATLRQAHTVTGGFGYWIQPINLHETIYELFQITMSTIMPEWSVFLAAPALGALIFFALLSGFKGKRWELLSMAFGPLLVVLAISLIWKPVLLYRGLIGSIPALLMLAAESLDNRRAWFWPALAVPALTISLVCLVIQNSQGTTKGKHNPVLYQQTTGTVYHMGDTTLIPYMLYRPNVENIFLDTGCTPDPGALTAETRAALGVKTIPLAGLPQSFTLAAVPGPLSTQCAVDVFHQLTDQARAVEVDKLDIGVNGVWNVNR